VTIERQALGRAAEDRAADALLARGYVILARRYRTRHGEIDIVARDGDTTVVVEVKARLTGEFGTAAEAITPQKQRRLISMAKDYLARHDLLERPCRFDVVAIDGPPGRDRIVIYPSAFTA
jgi:putative endonuclease